MAARDPRGARARRRGAAGACVTLVTLLAVGCGTPESGGEAPRAAPRERAPVVSGLAAYVAESEGRTVVVTGALDDSSWRVDNVPGDPAPEGVHLTASADGRVVAVSVHADRTSDFRMRSLHVLDVRTGSIRRLPLPEGRVRELPAVSPDGRTVALVEDVRLSLVPTGGGTPTRLPAALRAPALDGTWLGAVRWSPDGRSLLYELWQTDPGDPRPSTTGVEYVLLTLARPRPKVLAGAFAPGDAHGIANVAAAWSPDSRRVAVAGDPWSTDAIKILALRGGGTSLVYDTFPLDLAWTRRGIYTFVGDRPRPTELVLVDPDTHVRRTVTRQPLADGETIIAPASGDVVALLAGTRLRVFSPTGERVLDRSLRGAPDAPAKGGFTVVLVDP